MNLTRFKQVNQIHIPSCFVSESWGSLTQMNGKSKYDIPQEINISLLLETMI